MRLRIFILLTALFVCGTYYAQDKQEKFYYKDTLFEFNGCKIEVMKTFSDDKSFRSVLNITNTGDNFLMINPWEVFGLVGGSAEKYNTASKRTFIIPPKYTKKLRIKFIGRDFREPDLIMDFSKLTVTTMVERVYEFNVDLSNENYKDIGPIRFTILKQDPDNKSADFRITAQLEYTGNKFLGIFYNNIMLKTKDGGSFINTGKKAGDFHYDKDKPLKKMVLIFPVESKKVKKDNQPTLSFANVLKEYQTAQIVGFKINLRAGTLEDYKGKSGSADDKESEDME
jgi:hypothetical protein